MAKMQKDHKRIILELLRDRLKSVRDMGNATPALLSVTDNVADALEVAIEIIEGVREE